MTTEENNFVDLRQYSFNKIQEEQGKPSWGYSEKMLRAIRYIKSIQVAQSIIQTSQARRYHHVKENGMDKPEV